MERGNQDKMMRQGDVETKAEAPAMTEYFYPDKNFTVRAASQEEADAQYFALAKTGGDANI